ncbi:uncharacterized protein FOMMEDRAFT_158374 [Fomitiporia mediterranea MF3/22]|uniref:uncharacterized protein n=1 Tax=Fomitiporia mediterranea (strain MF3/22) TaxID=694068 RepID=UPI0004407EB2|nr:uncharacterized protein FOMMEDRAFT_158374 [Fomitiporia mediterranea MF3/22]EJD01243.1 hypothetical protein FOMMEDRAFT_158374 [Fomitiporia mediterranea MF3/22]
MSGFMSYFGGRKDPKQTTREAIVTLRQQLQMLEKKEEHLQKKVEEEMKKARANAVTNKQAATAALRRKKATEQELDRLAGTRLQLEMQVNTLESANFNQETMTAMKKGSDALKAIHGNLCVVAVACCARLRSARPYSLTHLLISFLPPFFSRWIFRTPDKVDSTMQAINEQREIANEISDAISNPMNTGDELKLELQELEQDELNERLAGAERAPTTALPSVAREEPMRKQLVEEDDEEAQLKELQAALAM